MIKRISFSSRLALAASLIAGALLSAAQAQKPQIESLLSPSAAPNVQIAQVRNLGIQGDDATLVIEVSWTATAPQTTHINGSQMLIEVEYADRSKDKTVPANATDPRTLLRVLKSESANIDDGSKRQATLKVTDVPSGTGDLSIHVKATVKAFVTIATTKTIVKEGSF